MSTPAHIMMTTDTVGGVWVYATALCRELAEAGHRVTLVTLGPPPRGSRYEEARALAPSVDLIVTSLNLEWLDPDGFDAARARDELLVLANRIHPDLVHVNGYREGGIPWPCPSIVVAHSCVWSWWQAVRGGNPKEPCWHAYARAVRDGLNNADAWVAPSDAFRHSINRIYQPETAGGVIANGIDFPSQPQEPKQPIILASGRVWDEAKNLTALAEIARDLPWPVYIAGAGMPDDSTRWPNVHWLGEIAHAQLQAWMRRAAIYVAPVHYEPFGLAILEAARAGGALVLSDIGSLRELWDGAALHVPAKDTDRLRSTIAELCVNGGERRRLQRAAAIRARRYSLSRTVAGYRELYGRVLTRAAETKPADPELAA